MMYSSTDLLNWENLGAQDSSVTGMWRPKFAKPNGEFWVSGLIHATLRTLVPMIHTRLTHIGTAVRPTGS